MKQFRFRHSMQPIGVCRGSSQNDRAAKSNLHLVRRLVLSLQFSLLCLAVLSIASLVQAQLSTQAPRKIVQELIYLNGENGAQIPAILTYPATGINTHSPALVHVHGGPGGGPLSGAPRFAAEGLAERGYTSVSIKLRQSSGQVWMNFSSATPDIKAAVDFLTDLGIRDVILTGHSLGSITCTRYMVETNDPRIKAMIHYAPTRDLSPWMRTGMGEEYYWRTVDKATKAIAEGRGGEEMIDVHYNYPPPSPPNRPFDLVQTAANWLDFWGPAAQTRNTVWMAQLKVPMLMLAGDKDIFVTKEYLAQLKSIAKESPRVDTIWYTGGVDHGFDPIHDRVVADSAKWLEEIGYGVRGRVTTQLVSTKASDGRALEGVLFTPAEGTLHRGPVFLLLHGWTSDAIETSPPWLGEGLAQHGYVALAMQNRTSGFRNQESDKFEDISLDIKAWVDYLEKIGYPEVVGEGHSFGGIRFSYYLTESKDPRVKGMVYLAPTRNAPAWMREGLGPEKYDAVVAEAQKAIQDGSGGTHLISFTFFMPPPATPGKVEFPIIQYADSFLRTWGPKANTVHTDKVAMIKIPILSLAGSKDVFVSEDYIKEFTKAAGGPAQYIWYGGPDGADHMFQGYEDRAVSDIANWTAKTFPGTTAKP